MEIIKSKENKIFKELVKLQAKKYRDKTGLFIIEGVNLVREAVVFGVDLKFVVINSEKIDEEIKNNLDMIISKLGDLKIYYFSNQLFKRFSDTVNPQGICAVAGQNKISNDDFFAKQLKGNFVVLDSVQNPGNVGTIMRTAEASGYAGIISVAASADMYSPKVVRACAGTLFRLPILYIEKMKDAIELLKKQDKKIVCLDMEAEKAYFETDLKENIALVLGNEGNGISEEAFKAADLVINIPMMGKIESLNVAIAAGIVMYENMRA
ncbi:MAG: TrmH family RNA methyltransferase [Eubacteriales bacterium]